MQFLAIAALLALVAAALWLTPRLQTREVRTEEGRRRAQADPDRQVITVTDYRGDLQTSRHWSRHPVVVGAATLAAALLAALVIAEL